MNKHGRSSEKPEESSACKWYRIGKSQGGLDIGTVKQTTVLIYHVTQRNKIALQKIASQIKINKYIIKLKRTPTYLLANTLVTNTNLIET